MYDELVNLLRDSEHQIDCCLCDRDCCYPDGKVHGKCIIIKAADAIEELSKDLDSMNEANIALYGALPKWIPVAERLPKDGTDVLAYIERDAWGDGDAPYRKREIAIGYHVNGRWHVDGCSRVDCISWQALPEPPKEEIE